MASHDTAKIRSQLGKVSEALRAYGRDLDDETAYHDILKAVDDLNRLTRWADLDIADFFRSVGEGLVAAQSDLDEKTLEGFRSAKPHAPPAVYRIPKVSADIQFALQSKEGKKFNILLFGSEEERRESRQHRVSFDVVAAPPPPDVLSQIEASHVERAIIVDPEIRNMIRQLLKAFVTRNTGREAAQWKYRLAKARKFARADVFPKVLVLPESQGWICVLPTPKSPTSAANLDLLWLFDSTGEVNVEGPKQDPTALSGMPSRLHVLAQVLGELSVRQAQALQASTGSYDRI